MAFKMKGFAFYDKSPLEQYDWTVVDNRSDEEKNKEKEEIAKEEERKVKEQEKLQQQIEGTYVETEEDIQKRKEKWEGLHRPR